MGRSTVRLVTVLRPPRVSVPIDLPQEVGQPGRTATDRAVVAREDVGTDGEVAPTLAGPETADEGRRPPAVAPVPALDVSVAGEGLRPARPPRGPAGGAEVARVVAPPPARPVRREEVATEPRAVLERRLVPGALVVSEVDADGVPEGTRPPTAAAHLPGQRPCRDPDEYEVRSPPTQESGLGNSTRTSSRGKRSKPLAPSLSTFLDGSQSRRTTLNLGVGR